MKEFNFGNVLEQVKNHVGIMVRGIARTLYGALIAGLLVIAVYGFIGIQSESGYLAVFDFIAALATLSIALCNVYLMGKRQGKRGKAKK
jgi:hypothetical protein